ncbi:hypothetical protein MT1_0232 [Pseudomonas sp. MT-1]|nr:hypothetical protein C1896_00455 [Pseudomonadaceae bacterium SI-3]BAP77408.1 hypothetical protein MT1_0232 [Pseudomonas sp. MT-1]
MLAINNALQPRIASKLAPTKTARLSDAHDPYRICLIDLPSRTAWASAYAADRSSKTYPGRRPVTEQRFAP